MHLYKISKRALRQSLPPQEPVFPLQSRTPAHTTAEGPEAHTLADWSLLWLLPNSKDKLNLFLLPSCLLLFPRIERSLLQTRSFWQPSSRKSPGESIKIRAHEGDSQALCSSQRVKLQNLLQRPCNRIPPGSPAPHLPVRACL